MKDLGGSPRFYGILGVVLLPIALAVGGATARAEAPAAPTEGDSANGRFAMTPVADGFLRLDTRTGQTSLCSVSSGQVQCRAGADERAALQAEIDRLARENAGLKAAAPSTPQTVQDEEDRRFDRALDRAERFMRRMLQLFREAGDKPPPSNL